LLLRRSLLGGALRMSDKPEVYQPEKKMPSWVLPTLSWVVAGYFLLGFVFDVGFPPHSESVAAHPLFSLLWLFFLFLPFFTKIRIGKLLELERGVERAKEELREFRAEVRNSLSVLSTNVNTIGGMTNQVTVNVPGLTELRKAREVIEKRSPAESGETAQQAQERFFLEGEDPTLTLAWTRIEIERLLRGILGRRTSLASGKEEELKFAGVRQLFNLFISEHQELAYLKMPFRYVTQICNAAIHAQRLSPDQAREALGLGAQIIAVLKDLPNGQN
jgi:hypothetical protein